MPNTPDYIRIADELEASIRSGKRPAGSRLPTRTELRKDYDVGETTIRMAFVRLEAKNLICRRRGKGIYVAERLSESR